MLNIALGYGFCLLTALIVITGDYLLKVAADGGMALNSRHVIAGGLLYAFSAIMWYFAMRYMTLAQAGVVFSMLTLLALCLIGYYAFGERFYLREYAGVGCALAAMVLLVRVT
ncbi:undecaprenyl phosphate-alpha-L-ara4N flippase subunit ArnF [Litoreibacter meonggei]|uniref:Undecaprenyl phosphate-alpha-L-ara4N flippase subunit ArnF n=1 Tax=Litoreibacter meonggei TaxID=1049199 RepID=A0A497W8Y6_9RHOB|nr:hypothetical protein [Litoreibacter meonggei]RLJ51667.1 undecaprenyl phosphate-alpha-L-ara4N flippase subunit ArnF [Litoreibacter meonggei]